MATIGGRTEIMVGLFVLAALSVLGILSLRLGSETLAPQKGYELDLLVDTASGLAPNSRVEMAGIEIGRIKEVSIEGDRARVLLNIYPEYQVALDSTAWIRTKGLLGDKFIEVRQGHPDQGTFQPRGRIGKVVRPVDLDELFVDMGPVMEDLKGVAGGLGEVIGSEEGRLNLRESMANLREATASIKVVSNRMEKGEGALGKLLTDDTLYEDARESVATLKKVADKVNRGEGTLGKLISDEDLYEEAEATIGSLKAFAEMLEKGEGTLGKLASQDDLYRQAEETLTALREVAEKVKSGEGTLGKLLEDESLYSEAKEALHNVNKAAEGVQEQVPVTIFGTLVGTAVR